MVIGIDRWKEFFKDYKDKYVLIGGAACNLLEEEFDMTPRATKDLDLVLVVEVLSPDFGQKLWDFIKSANYMGRSKGENKFKHEYYRFTNPEDTTFPKQIELFARKTGILSLPSDARIQPISVGDNLSSLSAILMDDDYYAFTMAHSINIDDIHLASPEALICLKAKAYIEMLDRKSSGEQVDSRDIEKHKKDVFRLIAMLPQDSHFNLPEKLKSDMSDFYDRIGDLPNADFFVSAGLKSLDSGRLLNLFRNAFPPRHLGFRLEGSTHITQIKRPVVIGQVADRHVGIEEGQGLLLGWRHLLVKHFEQIAIRQGYLFRLEILLYLSPISGIRDEMGAVATTYQQ